MNLQPFGLVHIHRPDNPRTPARYLDTPEYGKDLLSFEGDYHYHGHIEHGLINKVGILWPVHKIYWLLEDYPDCPRCCPITVAEVPDEAGVISFLHPQESR